MFFSPKSCPTLYNPMDCKTPGSSVHGLLQARILEWVAISSSRGSSQPKDLTHVSGSAALQVESLPPSRLGSPITFTHSANSLHSECQRWKLSHACLMEENGVRCVWTPNHITSPWMAPSTTPYSLPIILMKQSLFFSSKFRKYIEFNLPDPGIEPRSPALRADSLLSEPPRKPLRMDAMLQTILLWKYTPVLF